MPPWVASVPRPTTYSRAPAIDRIATLLRGRNATKRAVPLKFRVRSASTLVSPTAINYRPNVPPKNEELYNALSGLSGAAEQYVNLSRLQLALRGLATENAVTRVAVLGLNSQIGAQRLVRLLVADPLGDAESWEKELGERDDGAVLLRFGDANDAHPPSPLYKILSVPSRVLKTHNLEILVSTLNVNIPSAVTSVTESSNDAVLVPKLEATSARGLPVPYPVHKTLILGENLDSAIAYGKFSSDSAGTEDMVKVAIDLSAPVNDAGHSEQSVSTAVNIAIGTKGLDALRASIANSSVYEKNWFASGLPVLSKWLTSSLQPDSLIKPAHITLISSLLDDIEANITKEEAQRLSLLASTMTQEQLSSEIIGYLEQWAEKSHRELRDSLDEAFASKNWRKLAWWKLFWRVDDIGMILEEVLERRWLVSAEKDGVYLAGRMKQAGFPDELRHPPTLPVSTPEPEAIETEATPAPATEPLQTTDPQPTDLSTDVKLPLPWPSLIPSARSALLASSLPPLQALAQRLILTTLSTTSLSSALSALLYISVSTVSLFEASAIAALGLMFSLRSMQKKWEGMREAWMREVREEGRQVLKSTEGVVMRIIGLKSGKGEILDEGVEERRRAKESVERVREVLEMLKEERK